MPTDAIRLAFQCPMRWEQLTACIRTGGSSGTGGAQPTDGRRYCGACEKHVHDLSALTRVEAEALLVTARLNPVAAPICVRVRVDAQGRSIHKPAAPPKVRRCAALPGLAAGLAAGLTAGLAAGLTAGLAAGLAGCGPEMHADPVTVASPTHSDTAAVTPNVKDVPVIPEVQTAIPAATEQTAPRKARRAPKRAVPHDAELGVVTGVGPARELLGEPTQDLLGAPLSD